MHSHIFLLRLPPLSHAVLVISPCGESLLGRSTKCDLVIDHLSVSRRHALLLVDGLCLRITDLASKNGTFVEDSRLAGTAVISPGNRIRFGSLSYLLVGHADSVEGPGSSLDTDNPDPQCRTSAHRTGSEQLSMAQQRVFRLLVDGLSEKRIASRLGISSCTVHNHIGAIYRTFGVHSRAELLVLALAGKAAT